MQPPERFKSGETLKYDIGPKLNRLIDYVRGLEVFGDGRSVMAKKLHSGTYLSSPRQPGGGGGGGGISPVKLSAKVNYNTYTGSVYANGTDATATETGVTIRVLQIATTETIPANTILPAWKQKWAGTEQWTVDVARDY